LLLSIVETMGDRCSPTSFGLSTSANSGANNNASTRDCSLPQLGSRQSKHVVGAYSPAAPARTVYVGNLPATVPVDELLNLVHFGGLDEGMTESRWLTPCLQNQFGREAKSATAKIVAHTSLSLNKPLLKPPKPRPLDRPCTLGTFTQRQRWKMCVTALGEVCCRV